MKILFLAAANSTHTVKWVNSLCARAHKVHLVYNSGHNPAEDKINKGVELHQLRFAGKKRII